MTPRGLWRAHVDGGCDPNPGGVMGIGVVLQEPGGDIVAELSESPGLSGTNNIAEYTAVLRALEETKRRGGERLEVVADSRLTVGTLSGHMRARAPHLIAILDKIRALQADMEEVRYRWVPRAMNADADRLSTLAITAAKRRAGIVPRGAPPAGATGASPAVRHTANDWRCSCGRESIFRWQVTKDGRRQIRQECPEHGFLRFAPREKSYMGLAGPEP
jgi:ribonuclease HI